MILWNSSMCRACSKSKKGNLALNLKNDLIDDKTYLDIFNSLANLEAQEDDELPQNICTDCSAELIKAFQFRKRIIDSDNAFRNSLKEIKEVQKKYFVLEGEEDFLGPVKEEPPAPDIEIEIELDNVEDVIKTDEVISDTTFETVHCEPIDDIESDNESYQQQYEEFVEEEEELTIEPTEVEYLSLDEIIEPSENGTIHKDIFVECHICGKLLKQRSLKHHLTRCHKKDKIHLCSSCPKSFTVQSDLKIHMKTHDTDRKRNFICTICRKGFYEKQSLNVHMLRHEGVKKFLCKICEKRFTTKKSLEVHEFTHNRQNGRFMCKHCGKKFPSNADLIVHERFHTGDYPYQCEYCDKSYAVKSHFNYHMAKHKGITYKCDQCDKEFMNRGSLTAHRFKHNDKMPHECPICNKGFPSPFKLNRHKNSHKTEDLEAAG